jgi:hypothetical protein
MYTERWQRHPLTYVGRGRFWHGLLTKYGICFRDKCDLTMLVDICSSIQLAGDFQVSGTAYTP